MAIQPPGMLFRLPAGSPSFDPHMHVCPGPFHPANLNTSPASLAIEPQMLNDMTVPHSALNPGHGGPPHVFTSAGHQRPNAHLSFQCSSTSTDPFMAPLAIAPTPMPKPPVLYGTHCPWSFAAWVSGNSECIQYVATPPAGSTMIPHDHHATKHGIQHQGWLLFLSSNPEETQQTFEDVFGHLGIE